MERKLERLDIATEIEKAILAAPASERYVIVNLKFKDNKKEFKIIIDRQSNTFVVRNEKDDDVTTQFLQSLN